MKVIIDIDDEQVLFDIENRSLEAQTETDKVIINALYNGTPLPKNHGRLIDEDQIPGDNGWDFSDRLMATPTIIEAESEE